MVILGAIVGLVSWLNVTLWAIFAQRISHKVRLLYFTSCLEKDAKFYDINSPNEMSAKIAKECSAIQRGLGEKVGQTIMSISGFFFGFAFAFTYGWEYSTVLLGVVPCIALTGVLMAMSLESGITQMMRAYAQSAGYAEQALHAIRVVHSYGQEAIENENYKEYLVRASDV
jgi:ATP-binding cassette subfamily B (MDR/TAP) protein 1